jgi:hypothetical protein
MLESTPIHSEVYRKLVERLKAPPQLRLGWVFSYEGWMIGIMPLI